MKGDTMSQSDDKSLSLREQLILQGRLRPPSPASPRGDGVPQRILSVAPLDPQSAAGADLMAKVSQLAADANAVIEANLAKPNPKRLPIRMTLGDPVSERRW
jgi:hypothetical protein